MFIDDNSQKGIEIVRKDSRITSTAGGIEIKRTGKPVSAVMSGTGIVYILIDSSGSMTGSKFTYAQMGAVDFAEDAKNKDYKSGIITFGSTAHIVCEPTKDINHFKEKIKYGTFIGGGTNMAEALRLAIQKMEGKTETKVIVVVTDGMPNDPEFTLATADMAKRNSIDIIAIGTDDADRSFLDKLASRKELSMKVQNIDLQSSLKSSAGMLPLLSDGFGKKR
jgi:Ca-activated chloride channel homolog